MKKTVFLSNGACTIGFRSVKFVAVCSAMQSESTFSNLVNVAFLGICCKFSTKTIKTGADLFW